MSEMRTSEHLDKIAAALLAFQKEVEPITKTKENPYFKSMYADLCSLFAHCKPLMQKNGLLFTSVGLTSRLMHSSGQWIEGDFTCEMHGLSAQQVGSAMTYGRRYNFQGLLGINAEDDDDAQAASTKPAAQATRKAVKPVAPVKPSPAAPADEDRVPAEVTDGQAAEAVNTDGMELVAVKGYNPKPKQNAKGFSYGVVLETTDGEKWWNTFSKTVYENAKALKGKNAFAKFEQNGEYTNLTELVSAENAA